MDEEGLRIHLNSLRNWQLGLNEALKMYGLTLKNRIEKLNEQWNQEFKSNYIHKFSSETLNPFLSTELFLFYFYRLFWRKLSITLKND